MQQYCKNCTLLYKDATYATAILIDISLSNVVIGNSIARIANWFTILQFQQLSESSTYDAHGTKTVVLQLQFLAIFIKLHCTFTYHYVHQPSMKGLKLQIWQSIRQQYCKNCTLLDDVAISATVYHQAIVQRELHTAV